MIMVLVTIAVKKETMMRILTNKELCRMRGVEQDDKLWGQHKASVEDIKAQMVELWKSLSREEREAISE